MAEQATVIRFRAQAKDKLAFWLPDKIDEMMFLAASGRAFTYKLDGSARGATAMTKLAFASDVTAPTSTHILYGGSASAETGLTSADKMTWTLCVNARAKAERLGVRPIRQGGKDYYVIVMSPEQRRDLISSSDYMTNVSRAAERGSNNPLFANSMVTVDGLVLYSHRKVFNTLNGTSGASTGYGKWGSGYTVDGAQAIVMGAQALGFATIGNGQWAESDKTDYGNRPGIGYGRKIGIVKPQFKKTPTASKTDYGCLQIKTAAA